MARSGDLREIRHELVSRMPMKEGAPAPVPEPDPDSPVAAATVEQPLPLMVAEMSFWALGAGLVAIPLAAVYLAAAPIVLGSRLLPPRLLRG